MDLKAQKLRIISRILQTDDPQILETIEGLLSLTSDPDTASPDPGTFSSPVTPPPKPGDPEVQELQASIDAIFQGSLQAGKDNVPDRT